MKCGTYNVFDWFETADTGDKNVFWNPCPGLSALNFAQIPMIFCRRIFWVVPECSAKFGHNCSIFCEIAAVLNLRYHIFPLFSQSVLVISAKISRNIVRGKGVPCPWIWPRATLTSWNSVISPLHHPSPSPILKGYVNMPHPYMIYST